MTTVSTIMEKIQGYSPDANLQPVMTAYLLAARAHSGQMRKSGEPYLSHPIAVAEILADMRMDVETIATALTRGDRFGVIAIAEASIPRHLRATRAMGVADRLVPAGRLRRAASTQGHVPAGAGAVYADLRTAV